MTEAVDITKEDAASEPKYTAEQIIAAYLKWRGEKEKLEAEHKEKVQAINKKLNKLEAWLQIKMHVDNLNALPTNAGTAYKLPVEHASVSDMDALLEFIKANDAWHLLEKRVSKTGVRAYLDENQPLPPGVNWYTSVSIGVRKPNER